MDSEQLDIKALGYIHPPSMESKLGKIEYPPIWPKRYGAEFRKFCVRNYYKYATLGSEDIAVNLIKDFLSKYPQYFTDTSEDVSSFKRSFCGFLKIIKPFGSNIVSSSVKVCVTGRYDVVGIIHIRNPKEHELKQKDVNKYRITFGKNGTDLTIRYVISGNLRLKTSMMLDRLRRNIYAIVSDRNILRGGF